MPSDLTQQRNFMAAALAFDIARAGGALDDNRMDTIRQLEVVGAECRCYQSERVVVLIRGTKTLAEVDRIMANHGMTASTELLSNTAGTAHLWMREYFGPWM